MKSVLIGLFFLSGLPLLAAYDPSHAGFTKLLSTRVHQGVVDYAGIKKEPAALDQYLLDIADVSQKSFNKMGREEQMAYLINAYNAFTLKLISDFYPVDSIRDIGGKVGGGIFGRSSKQWKVSEYEANGHKTVFKAMGKPITLDEIEHENLRPKYKDARVHFALVCGAVSCPFLRSEAYVGSRIGEQLDDQGRQFLKDKFRNQWDQKKDELYLSKIFDWFSDDFKRSGDLYDFVKKFLPAEAVSKLSAKPTIKFLPYDWSLNSRAGSST